MIGNTETRETWTRSEEAQLVGSSALNSSLPLTKYPSGGPPWLNVRIT